MRVGQQVKVKTIISNGYEKIVTADYSKDFKIKELTILSTPNYYNSFYSILVEDSMLGWTINQTHIDYNGINKKYLGKKFFDVSPDYFVKD